MIIKYEFANGETSEVEVDDEIGALVIKSRTEEDSIRRRTERHCLSLGAFPYEGEIFIDRDTLADPYEQTELSERTRKALDSLTEIQRKRLLMLASGMSARQIADREGTNHKSVLESINAARKNFLKNF